MKAHELSRGGALRRSATQAESPLAENCNNDVVTTVVHPNPVLVMTLWVWPQAPTGATGPVGATGAVGSSLFGAMIPAGTQVTGACGGLHIRSATARSNSYLISYRLSGKTPQPRTDGDVIAAPNSAAGEPPVVHGAVGAATAHARGVCIYVGSLSWPDNAGVTGFSLATPGSSGSDAADANRFTVRILDTGTVVNTPTTSAEGTWADAAP